MRSKQEIRGIVGGFAQSGMTRWEYCASQNIGIATLDDWRRIEKKGAKLLGRPYPVKTTVGIPSAEGLNVPMMLSLSSTKTKLRALISLGVCS
jgi:hypothetical protein